jgi:hypothetical protein
MHPRYARNPRMFTKSPPQPDEVPEASFATVLPDGALAQQLYTGAWMAFCLAFRPQDRRMYAACLVEYIDDILGEAPGPDEVTAFKTWAGEALPGWELHRQWSQAEVERIRARYATEAEAAQAGLPKSYRN